MKSNRFVKGDVNMPLQLSKFTLRIDSELLKKFRFVADYNARSANREIEVLMKKHVDEFEKKHGSIELD
jgi:hypothetical protein